MKRIKQLIDDNPIYGVADYDYTFDSELKNQDKEDIIECYLNLFKLVRDIKEIVDKEIN